MKKIFRFKKNEKVKEVYINGLRNFEPEDYTIKGNNLKFSDLGYEIAKGDVITFTVEKIEKI